jgi:hypothetical protein
MNVRFDHMTSGMPHVAELLRIAGRGKEINARLMKIAAQDYSKFNAAESHALDHDQFPKVLGELRFSPKTSSYDLTSPV